jgi:hypothetical protein
MTATVTTWLDGRVQTVPADDPRLAAIQTARHIANLHRISPARARVAYFDEYEKAHDRAARIALQDAFAADWEARRAQR